MKRRTETATAALDESLQADVMRFMAIIAFCLVAIMALARNAAPLEAQSAEVPALDVAPDPVPVVAVRTTASAPRPEAPVEAPAPVPMPVPSAPPEELAEVRERPSLRTAAAPVVEPVVEPVGEPMHPAESETVAEPVGEPVGEPSGEPVDEAPEPVEVQVAAAPAEDPAPVPDATRAPEAAADEEADEGLSLRFASDGDFMRLVSREAIEVFAFREGEVLALSPGLRFAAARAPGQVHELLPATIPAPIAAALADARADAARFAWGVRMPGRIERRVRAHVDAGDSGVLVIDRFGEVRLLATSPNRERNG